MSNRRGVGGRKRKPDHLKVVAGTDQPSRMNPNAPKAPKELPEAPEWLSKEATKYFDRLVETLVKMGIASSADIDVIAHCASRLYEIEECTAIIEDLGKTYQTTTQAGDTMFRARPEVAMRNEAMRHAQSLLGELGLTPAARSRVTANPDEGDNEFSKLG